MIKLAQYRLCEIKNILFLGTEYNVDTYMQATCSSWVSPGYNQPSNDATTCWFPKTSYF